MIFFKAVLKPMASLSFSVNFVAEKPNFVTLFVSLPKYIIKAVKLFILIRRVLFVQNDYKKFVNDLD